MIKKYLGIGNLIAVLSIFALMLAVAIVCETPTPKADASEIIIEYHIEDVEEVEEDGEVDFASDYEYYNWLIGYAAELNGIDSKLAISISRLETGNWKNIKEHYNFGGLSNAQGKPYKYASEVEGLEAYMKTLSYYRDKGMDTPEKMSKVYCPANDKWAELVEKIMEEI